jgi:hypothetical protein
MSLASMDQVHRQFEAVLPQLDAVIRFQFRRWPRHRRAEAIADALAASWHAWHGLLARGQDPQAVGPTGIAFNACRYVKGGRRLGTGRSVRSGMDVYNPRACEKRDYKLISLDLDPVEGPEQERGRWRDWLSSDNGYTPADQAAFQLDFAAWLDLLPPRKRRMAELLVEGHETGAAAELLGVSAGLVSQARRWLAESWRSFQGEAVPSC